MNAVSVANVGIEIRGELWKRLAESVVLQLKTIQRKVRKASSLELSIYVLGSALRDFSALPTHPRRPYSLGM